MCLQVRYNWAIRILHQILSPIEKVAIHNIRIYSGLDPNDPSIFQ
jgi:hypothetical protein